MRRKRRAGARFYVLIIALMVLFFGVSGIVSHHRLNKAAAHADALELERDTLRIRIDGLMKELEYVRSDEFILRTAREKLKLIMPGEIRYTAN
ncbi:MAG: septum formation initiator family protein [Clostridia bacterium]|nr:septum formation initiator family protein [Clostridia bacterium]